MLLICLGVLGLGRLLAPLFDVYGTWLFALAALWLAGYGILRLRDGLRMASALGRAAAPEKRAAASLRRTLSVVAVLAFANPHVYLDTVVLLGSLSVPYQDTEKLAFTAGASVASLLFFLCWGLVCAPLQPLYDQRSGLADDRFCHRVCDVAVHAIVNDPDNRLNTSRSSVQIF